ncbi:hypothetical protein EV146_11921 [Mesobacillus foraminis]|uniref:Uncharacterized protein n=1 Tax=Mesobacillus foraminis TaxID=279826 RepID=A0A4R2B091_9BACI|nr:hypothetical protein EV146_11921 [Mesobacillus foraminis]
MKRSFAKSWSSFQGNSISHKKSDACTGIASVCRQKRFGIVSFRTPFLILLCFYLLYNDPHFRLLGHNSTSPCPIGHLFQVQGSESKHRLHRQYFLNHLRVVQCMPCFSFASANIRSVVSFRFEKCFLLLVYASGGRLLFLKASSSPKRFIFPF